MPKKKNGKQAGSSLSVAASPAKENTETYICVRERERGRDKRYDFFVFLLLGSLEWAQYLPPRRFVLVSKSLLF